MNVEYSCLMPTVHKYTESLGGDAMFFGLLLSTFSIVRMIVFIPIGWWADERPFREVFSVTAGVGLVGCFIYGAAGALGNKNYLILGRVLTGFGAANTTLSRSYISQCVDADEFGSVIGKQMVFDLLGVMLGPALIAFVRGVSVDIGWFHFNEETAPGYIMAALQLGMLASFLTIFTEPPPKKNTTIRKESIQEDEGKDVWSGVRRCLGGGGGWFMVLTTFCVNFQLCALETVATPLMEKNYGWESLENSVFFAGAAFVGMLGMVSGIKFGSSIGGRVTITMGLGCMGAGFALWLAFDSGHSLPMAPFLGGGAVLIYGICLVTPSNSAYFTQIVEYEGGNQGLLGGIWSVFMSAGKSTGPLVAGYALQRMDKGTGNWIVFVLCTPVLALNILSIPAIAGKMGELDKVVDDLRGLLGEGDKGDKGIKRVRRGDEGDLGEDDLESSLLHDFSS
ncbi:hypothetical protein TrRE_jg5703 [Triparma retinervis]|uniref:Major facilitator superfamily (MFS) profile domain-containing protein n=1 Tax=Triparma retinervis TaxID=2557542 RepID=A0A9W6ZH06_9STRA|nr:hypothetical protein TrRE_jg5703 [Triparma retinervis]